MHDGEVHLVRMQTSGRAGRAGALLSWDRLPLPTSRRIET